MKIQKIKLSDTKINSMLRVIATAEIAAKGFYTCTIKGVKTRIVK